MKPEDITGLTDERIDIEINAMWARAHQMSMIERMDYRGLARRIETIVTDSVGGAWAKACAEGVRIARDLAVAEERKARGHVARCSCYPPDACFDDPPQPCEVDPRCAPPDKSGGDGD